MSMADYEAVVKLSDGFNGADLRNVCTEAGVFWKEVGRGLAESSPRQLRLVPCSRQNLGKEGYAYIICICICGGRLHWSRPV